METERSGVVLLPKISLDPAKNILYPAKLFPAPALITATEPNDGQSIYVAPILSCRQVDSGQ